MNLYEITSSDAIDKSHMRCYAWAKDEEQALEMAQQSFEEEKRFEKEKGREYDMNYWESLKTRLLFGQEGLFSPAISTVIVERLNE